MLHPEYVYYFDERDFEENSAGAYRRSFWLKHLGTESQRFDKKSLNWNNLYTSNNFTLRSFLLENPLPTRCLEHGFGVEDWTWNAATVASGIDHYVVPDTVHLVRVTGQETLSGANTRLGLLPDLQDHFTTLH